MLIDYTKISDEPTTFEILPEGNYNVVVADVQRKTSEKSGNEYWAITFWTEDRAKIFDNLVFTDKTLNRVKKMFKNLGLPVDGAYDYEPADLIGRKMVAAVLIEEYTDRQGTTKQKNTIDVWTSVPLKDSYLNSTELISENEIPF